MYRIASSQRGVSLIELMIAVVVVAIMAAIAYPAYQEHVYRVRRADAYDALLHVQNLQEKHRANNSAYGASLTDIGFAGAASAGGHYELAISEADANGFTATAVAQGRQSGDVECATISLVVSADNPRGLKGGSGTGCW